MRSQTAARSDAEQQQSRERRTVDNHHGEQAAAAQEPAAPRPASKRKGRARKKAAAPVAAAAAPPATPNSATLPVLPPTFSGTEAHLALLAENDGVPTEEGIFVHTVVGPADDTVRKIAGLYARLRSSSADGVSQPCEDDDTETGTTHHHASRHREKTRGTATTALVNDILRLNDSFGGLSASAKLLYVPMP